MILVYSQKKINIIFLVLTMINQYQQQLIVAIFKDMILISIIQRFVEQMSLVLKVIKSNTINMMYLSVLINILTKNIWWENLSIKEQMLVDSKYQLEYSPVLLMKFTYCYP
ncbi:hypothetical protein SS50377_22199 [Spironucleus salmonicida]|uniref:Uncharacterized protein n=1 Tax=Spironucleus salmonicida TaxID=348837 RepID=A0A9P8S156_9EUKA|nr:hypothetical protein SS50377_22199 [Spironucleus salmonicida]